MKAWIVLLTCLGMIAGLSGCQTSSNGQANMLQTAGT
jgi:ABC-type Zn uptake system ZnuABC Zn-binding protein ZnuA